MSSDILPSITAAENEALRELCAGFAIADADSIAFVARGTMGQVYRVRACGRQYALKVFFDEPNPAAIANEVEFTRSAIDCGLAAPLSIEAVGGGLVVPSGLPGLVYGRLYTWSDGRPLGCAAAHLADAADMLAILHRTEHRSDQPSHPWYERVPTTHDWDVVLEQLATARSPWAKPLTACRAHIDEYSGWLVQPASADRYSCHLDVKPANILLASDGRQTLIDWDNAGPAGRGQELVCAMLDWAGTDPDRAPGAIATFMRRYRAADGPARPVGTGALSMYLATTINFLYVLAEAVVLADARFDPTELTARLAALPSPSALVRLSCEWERR